MNHGKYPFILSFLAIPVALYVWLVIIPFAQAFQISFTDWSGSTSEFNYIGFDNYVNLFKDEQLVMPAIRHTAIILVVLPLVTIVLGLFFAFMLNVGGKSRQGRISGVAGARFHKVVYFFPQVLSVAIIGILFQQVYAPETFGGLLTSTLSAVGLPAPPNGFLADKNFVLLSVISVLVWSAVGFYLVFFSSAMASIPQDLYEAAILDGASRIQTFFKITLPLLWESVQTAWIYLSIIALDVFVLVYIMTPERGGPDGASEVVGGVIWKYAFNHGEQAFASALGVVLFFAALSLAVIALRVGRRERIEY
ncbi:carbohydrate ABC transporter permease [Natronoglycomyces albus]|uniref:Sugar ABC transporter permease n=1 Tax=Natronoglycomyces albus TaxID=2811108 RepID=A0A895XLS5_9ACTN|nr:sugar ABC transporter permease [Natronoglycomyces albus]QSB04369.1 sugar ABC transporter permease [Natronoglycomyces albus]